MKAHKLTGEQAYNLGKHSGLYRRNMGDNYELLTFESYYLYGIIIARDERDSAVILREDRVYTFLHEIRRVEKREASKLGQM